MCRFIFQLSTIYAILNVCLVSSDCSFESVKETEDGNRLSKLQEYTKDKPIIIQDVNNTYQYSIAICTPVKGSTGEDVGVTQIKIGVVGKYVLGRISDAHIQVGNNWMFLRYHEGDKYGTHCNKEKRRSHIMISCDEDNQLVGNKYVLEENNNRTSECYYLFEITSSIACSEQPSSGLSLGSILIILFVCVIVVYILGGFLYQRFIIGAKGMEQFPNIAFWRDFGNLVADGCDLVFRSSPSDDSPAYRGLGDEDLGFEHNTLTMDQGDDDVQPLY